MTLTWARHRWVGWSLLNDLGGWGIVTHHRPERTRAERARLRPCFAAVSPLRADERQQRRSAAVLWAAIGAVFGW